MKEIYQLEIPIYNCCLWVFYGPVDDCVAAMKRLQDGEYIKSWREIAVEKPDTKGLYLYNRKENICILWLPQVPTSIADYGSLVHEIEHFVFRLFDNIGMTHSDDSDEAYAYLLSYVFKELDKLASDERGREEKKQKKVKK